MEGVNKVHYSLCESGECPPPRTIFITEVDSYEVFLCNEERKNSIEDCLNLTCFPTFIALHWKRDVSKERFQFILETSY